MESRDLGERVNVLYVGGEGRSGSTVVAAMLGQLPGYLPVGEVRGIWQAIRTNELCGCGREFLECDFWITVGDRAFGGWDRVDLDRMLRLDRTYARHRSLGRLMVRGRARSGRPPDLLEFRETLGTIYKAIRDASGCDVIVDSTKTPPYAFLLDQVPAIDLRVLHLVRDSRGVAHSWQKADVERPEYANIPRLKGTFMTRRVPWEAALEWDVKNGLFHVLSSLGVPRLLVHYEAFVSDPGSGLERISAFAAGAEDPPPEAWRTAHQEFEYEALPHHTLGGNRVRFSRGTVRLRPDLEWRSAMERRQRATVTSLTAPLLIAYGYTRPPAPSRRRSRQPAETASDRQPQLRATSS